MKGKAEKENHLKSSFMKARNANSHAFVRRHPYHCCPTHCCKNRPKVGRLESETDMGWLSERLAGILSSASCLSNRVILSPASIMPYCTTSLQRQPYLHDSKVGVVWPNKFYNFYAQIKRNSTRPTEIIANERHTRTQITHLCST